MAPESVNAHPTKKFFIENFTRDLTLEDVVLDLIDNSIDSFIRYKGIDLDPDSLLNDGKYYDMDEKTTIELKINRDKFSIQDYCGGIDLEHAKNDVFRFGRTSSSISSALGIYGIGLKRAIFKIGKEIKIESQTPKNRFRVDINVDEWMRDDDNWTFNLATLPRIEDEKNGTLIIINNIYPDISTRILDPSFLKKLKDFISTSYGLFLNKFIDVKLNEIIVSPSRLPITGSDNVSPARRNFTFDDVFVELIAGLADRKSGWNAETAGWYIICNGRVVVNADKTALTGWGLYGPQYVSKFRGFLGLAFFFSKDPSKLPWTTTKRGLNVESSAYQKMRLEMTTISRPVFSFLNSLYPNEDVEEIEERKIVEKLEPIDLKIIRAKPESEFKVTMDKPQKSNFVTVQYRAEKSKIEKVKKRINKPNYSASNVGKHTLDYFIKNECPE